ncbi:hypothetical protein KXW36_001590, partial [Aspergillus fumigatus]
RQAVAKELIDFDREWAGIVASAAKQGGGDAARTQALNGQIDRLGRPAGEGHAPAGGQDARHLIARHRHGRRRRATGAVGTVRIGETGIAQPVKHRLTRLGRQRRGGLIIEVDHRRSPRRTLSKAARSSR